VETDQPKEICMHEKETYKRDLPKRPTKETAQSTTNGRTTMWKKTSQKRSVFLKRDLQKRPTTETYKRDLQKRPTKKTYKRDPRLAACRAYI